MRVGRDSVRQPHRLLRNTHEQRQFALVTATQRPHRDTSGQHPAVSPTGGWIGRRETKSVSDRIAQQNEELEKLIKERDALLNR